MTENEMAHVEWFREYFPKTTQEALIRATDNYNAGLGAVPSLSPQTYPFKAATPTFKPAMPTKSWFTNFTDSIGKIGPALVQYKTQKNIMKIQLDRAKRGLPPLDTSQLAPTFRVQPELSPEMYSDLKSYAIPAAVGIALLLGLVLFTRKK